MHTWRVYNNLTQQWLKTIQKGNFFIDIIFIIILYYIILLPYTLGQHVFFQLSNLISIQESSSGPIFFPCRDYFPNLVMYIDVISVKLNFQSIRILNSLRVYAICLYTIISYNILNVKGVPVKCLIPNNITCTQVYC